MRRKKQATGSRGSGAEEERRPEIKYVGPSEGLRDFGFRVCDRKSSKTPQQQLTSTAHRPGTPQPSAALYCPLDAPPKAPPLPKNMAEQAANGAAAPPAQAAPAEAVPSAKAFAQRVAELAYASAGKPAPPPPGADKAAVPLVPIYVGIDRNVERNGATVEEQLREVGVVWFWSGLAQQQQRQS